MEEDVADLLLKHAASFFLGAVLFAFAFVVSTRLGFFKIRFRKKTKAELSFFSVLIVFSGFFLAVVVLSPFISILWLFFETESFNTSLEDVYFSKKAKGWIGAGSLMMMALAVIFSCRFLGKERWRLIWGDQAFKGLKAIFSDLSLGAAAWLVSYPAALMVSQLIASIVLLYTKQQHIDQVAVQYLKATLNDPALFVFMSMLIIFVVPMTEELLFRGVLQTWLKKIFSLKRSIVLSSIIFASFHFASAQKANNFEFLSALFVLALFLGWIYERQNSLWASIGLHATFNAVSVAMIFFEHRMI